MSDKGKQIKFIFILYFYSKYKTINSNIWFILYNKNNGKDEKLNSQNENDPNQTISSSRNMYYNIESDSSEYRKSDEDNDDGDVTDEDLLEMSTEEKQDDKYLVIFQNGSEYLDEEIMSVDDVNELKN